MNKKEFNDNVYGELSRVVKALTNPHRLEIVERRRFSGLGLDGFAN